MSLTLRKSSWTDYLPLSRSRRAGSPQTLWHYLQDLLVERLHLLLQLLRGIHSNCESSPSNLLMYAVG